jgi:hypothetical protein
LTVPAPDKLSTVSVIPVLIVTVAPVFTVSDFTVVLVETVGYLATPELMMTSVVEVGTIPSLQLAASDQTVLVPPTHVVCASTDPAITCVKVINKKNSFNLHDLPLNFFIQHFAYTCSLSDMRPV